MADFWRITSGNNWDALLSWSQVGSGGAGGVGNPTAADNAIFDAATPSGTVTVNVSATCLNLDLTKPSAGTLTLAGASALAISGSLIVRSNSNITLAYTGTMTFNATGAGFQLTSNGRSLACPIVFSGVGGEWTLQDALLTTGSLMLTNGLFDANGFSVGASSISSSNANTRTLRMGSGTWTTTATGTFWTTATTTGLTLTPGTSTLVNAAAGSRTPTFGSAAIWGLSIGGSGNITISNLVSNGTLDFTGYTAQWQNNTATCNGNIILATGMTVEAGASLLTLSPTAGTQTLDSKGVAWNQPITINATAGVTVQLSANLDMGTKTLTLTQGILDVNGKTLTCGIFSSSNANTRGVGFGSAGTIVLSSTGTVWNMATATGASNCTGTGTIKLTANSTSSKTFSGGGLSYPNLYIADGNTGEARVAGSNSFADIKVDPNRAIYFTAGTTQHLVSFTSLGVAGQLVIITSAAGSTATHALVKDGGGINSTDFVAVAHSVATPAAGVWYAGANSTDNNGAATAGSGWIFTVPPLPFRELAGRRAVPRAATW